MGLPSEDSRKIPSEIEATPTTFPVPLGPIQPNASINYSQIFDLPTPMQPNKSNLRPGGQMIRDAFQGYYKYIDDFIDDMKKVFPTLGDDWGVYVPEVKYLSPEPLVDYDTLALADYNNVHFVGDALSARGITVSGAQGTYVADYILTQNKEYPDFHEHF